MKNQKLIGAGLIALGIIFLIGFHFNFEGVFTLSGAVVFLVFYWLKGGNTRYRNVGFLISGVIFLHITGLIVINENDYLIYFEALYGLLGLAISFFLVFIIHTNFFTYSSWGKRYWPLIVSAFFGFSSIIVLFDEYIKIGIGEELLRYGIPILLIISGIVILLKTTKTTKNNDKDKPF
ncbi:hypothetical protein PV797_12425 [Clostridiaceae bacterium M8S5]|nr:hypothetical protein PV797_12425 [Clostridiaceae bacterium M8S5]